MRRIVDTGDAGAQGRDAPRSMQVADQLRSGILAGELRAGERVNEAQLSLRLGVSRTPTRAALHALAAEGLLDYETNRGFTVRAYTDASISEAFEIRAVLEGLACRFAAERAPDPVVNARIEAALAEGDLVLTDFVGSPDQMKAYRAANVAFHGAVMAAARNQMLDDTLRLALARPGTSLRNIVSFTEAQVRRRHDDHHRIYEAIRARDPWRAEVMMREHVTSIKTIQLEGRRSR
jgi:GntR family transcriptional regulator of vanillate catabolism